MYLSEIKIENFRMFRSGDYSLHMRLNPGLNLLVGENDAGKSAVMDAIRYTLGTTSQEYMYFTDDDFNKIGNTEAEKATKFSITLKFSNISIEEGALFVEYLTNENNTDNLYITLSAELGKARTGAWIVKNISRRSGKNGDGPEIDSEVRSNLWCTFLKPLRDAESELIPGRNSRLSQILMSQGELETHKDSILKIIEETEDALEKQEYLKNTDKSINDDYLSKISLKHIDLKSSISLVGKYSEDDRKLKQLFDKLELFISTTKGKDFKTKHGLGSNNLLFIAAELLLLSNNKASSNPLLLIEEPEAHLHPQAQIQLLDFLLSKTNHEIPKAMDKKGETEEDVNEPQYPPQVIMTTHSPNLSSKVPLENITILMDGKAYSLAKENTCLDGSDYKFLEKFLDVTKANLFFARGLLIVEGDAENILLPTIARLINYPIEKHAVSIINVGHTGLFRYARIFQRKNTQEQTPPINIACITDRDLRPNVVKKPNTGVPEEWQYIEKSEKNKTTFYDEYDATKLKSYLEVKRNNDKQNVKTFISPEWTLEYDLAFGKSDTDNLCLEVYQASMLAINSYNAQNRTIPTSLTSEDILRIKMEAKTAYDGWSALSREQKSALVYKSFITDKKRCSKTEAAYWLGQILEDTYATTPEILINKLPNYLTDAIKYACDIKTGARPSLAFATGVKNAIE